MTAKGVCFDLGGVLVRICSNWRHAATVAGANCPATDTTGFDDRPEFWSFQNGDLPETQYLEFLTNHLKASDSDQARVVHNAILLEPYPGTKELVFELKARGVPTGCVSNTNSIHWNEMVEGDGFPAIKNLDFKVGSHIAKASKPSPAIYNTFERLSGLTGPEILYFDDVERYVHAAIELGWNAVLIDPSGDTTAQMRHSLETFGLL